jgi:Photosynthesis system II assembly factor YCF48
MQDVPKTVLKRLQETKAAGTHPDADLLTAFAEQSLIESDRARVMEHLSRCSDCREVVALALPAMELVAVAASTTPARRPWFTWPVLRWGVAVAGIIAIASIGIVQYRQRQKNDTLVSSLASPNETTAAPQQDLPPSPPATESQEYLRQIEKKKQAQIQKRALASRADNLAENMLVRPANPASPAANALHGAPSGTTASGSIRTGSAGAAAPRAVLSAPRNTFAVAAGAKNATHEAAPRPAPSPSASQAVEATSSSQTVEVVESQVAPVTPPAKDQISDQLDEKQKELPSQNDSSKSLSVLKAKNIAAAQVASGAQRVSPRWSINADGALQRSFDAGKTWLDVNVNSGLVPSRSKVASNADNPYEQDSLMKKKVEAQPSPSLVFRAVSVQGAEVWAGGSAAMLYHSADSGAHWTRVLPFSPGATLTGDITSIEFSDLQHGRIATSAGQVWITADDGQTWRRQ